ncbi:MAG: hypothetical protein BWY91_02470 [bacterium ADurb.BinA028]|nr:MAG: hypothetical protein BWY91_02470 [bacterium ADurb.BinA028]
MGASGRCRRAGSQTARPGHVPLPLGSGPARRAPLGLHRDRRLLALPPDAGSQRPACPGLRRLRAARGAVCRADRSASSQDDRGQHRHHAPPIAASGTGIRRPTLLRDDRRGLLPMDPVDLHPDPGKLVRPRGSAPRRLAWGGSPHRRVGGGLGVGGAVCARVGGAGMDRVVSTRAGRRAGALPVGLSLGGASQLVSRSGHRVVQRGGHQRRTLRAGQLPGVPAQPASVDDADHGVCRSVGRRPGPGRVARKSQDHAAQLDRPVRGRHGDLPGDDGCGRGRRHRGLHDPARHAVRSDLHGARSRASAGRRNHPERGLARRHP